MIGNKFFIKHEGIVKEVVVSGVEQEYQPGLIKVVSTLCHHNGVSLGWEDREYWRDSDCKNLVTDKVDAFYCFVKTDGGYFNVSSSQTHEMWRNVDGVAEKGKYFVERFEIDPNRTNNNSVYGVMTSADGDTRIPFKSEELFHNKDNYDWMNKTIVVYNDGRKVERGALNEAFALNERQKELVETIRDAMEELSKSGVEFFYDTECCDLYAANKKPKGYEVSLCDGCGNEEIEGSSEWDELPDMAYIKFPNVYYYGYEEKHMFRKKEDAENA